MQVQREGLTVNTELVGRLKIGGRWFGPGSVVALDKSDVDVLEMRGLSKKPAPGAEPLNVEKKQVKVEPPPSKATPEEPAAAGAADSAADAASAPAATAKETTSDITTEGTGNGAQHQQSRGKRR